MVAPGSDGGKDNAARARGAVHAAPPPRAPTKAGDLSAELDSLSAMLGGFDWSNDSVEKCARVILGPQETLAAKKDAVLELKKLLCTTRECVFSIAQDVIDSGVLRGLVLLISGGGYADSMENSYRYGEMSGADDDLKLPAAFCLTNISAGNDDQTAAVVAAGAVEPLVALLTDRNEALRRQAAFCLANIAGSTSELRTKLIRTPGYLKGLQFAASTSIDKRIEELAAWNLRNLIVLGGPTFSETTQGLNLLADQFVSDLPPQSTVRALLLGGNASLTSLVRDSQNWFRDGAIELSPQTAVAFSGSRRNAELCRATVAKPKGAHVLRLTVECLSFVSRHEEGRAMLMDYMQLAAPLLFACKFNPLPSVRNFAAEAILNIAAHGTESMRATFIAQGAVPALGELIADSFSYSPHLRVLCADALHVLASTPPPVDQGMYMKTFFERCVYTRSTILAQQRAFALNAARNRGSSIPPSNSTDGWTVSVLEVAHSIFSETEEPQEPALREKCGRLIAAALAGAEDVWIERMLGIDLVKLVADITENASEVDGMTILTGGVKLGTGLKGERNQLNGQPNTNAADIYSALAPGDTWRPDCHYLNSCVTVIKRMLAIGTSLQSTFNHNITTLLINQAGALPRFKLALSNSGLPMHHVRDALNTIDKYFAV